MGIISGYFSRIEGFSLLVTTTIKHEFLNKKPGSEKLHFSRIEGFSLLVTTTIKHEFLNKKPGSEKLHLLFRTSWLKVKNKEGY